MMETHEEMAELFMRISSSPKSNVKVCVSSRPWIVFDDAFKGFPGLRLQDLTCLDIEAYVLDELQGHPRMRLLKEAEPEHASELVNEVVTKASGVFLWVALVVKSLLNGLRNRDGIDDLRRRLADLLSDISALYTHMVSHIEPLYQEQAARTFQIHHSLIVQDWAQNVTALDLEMALTARTPKTMGQISTPMDETEVRSKIDWLDVFLKVAVLVC